MPIEKEILERLRKNDSTLTHLYLNSKKLADSDINEELCSYLSNNTALTWLDLNSNCIGAAGAQMLAKVLMQNQTLTWIDLRWNKIDDAGVQALAKALEKNRSLIHILLLENQIGAAGAEALAHVLEKNQTLTCINLERNPIGDVGAVVLANALAKNQTLTGINLARCEIGNAGVEALARALEKNRMLTWVDLSHAQFSRIGVEALAHALEKNHTLTEIQLNCNQLFGSDVAALAQALKKNRTLTTLNLDDNYIEDNGAQALAQGLEQNRTLTTLKLNRNQIGSAGAQALFKLLMQNRILKVILTYNPIGDAGAKAVAKILEQNQTLTEVDFYLSNIGDEGAQALAEMLAKDRTLQRIELHWNNIGDVGVQALAQALVQNRSLISINLFENRFGNAGAQALVKALEQNLVLTNILFPHNQIDAGLVNAINSLISRNCERAKQFITAAHVHNRAAVKQFIREGVNINFRDPVKNWNSALHFAAAKGYADMFVLLLMSGATASIEDNDRKTALQLATEKRQKMIIKLMQAQAQLSTTLLDQCEKVFAIFQQADYQTALTLCKKHLTTAPKNAWLLAIKAEIKQSIKDEILFRQLQQTIKKQAEALYQEAWKVYRKDEFEKALKKFKELHGLAPDLYSDVPTLIQTISKILTGAPEETEQTVETEEVIKDKKEKPKKRSAHKKSKELLAESVVAEKTSELAQAIDHKKIKQEVTNAEALLVLTDTKEEEPFEQPISIAQATVNHVSLNQLSEIQTLKIHANSLYAKAKIHLEDGEIKEARIAYREAQEIYKELKDLGVDCQKRLDKIKIKLAELKQPQAAPSSLSEIAVAPPLLKKASVTVLADLSIALPADTSKRFNPPTANVKTGFFKQPVAAPSSISPASGSQVSSVNGLGGLLQVQPGERSSINTERPQLRK